MRRCRGGGGGGIKKEKDEAAGDDDDDDDDDDTKRRTTTQNEEAQGGNGDGPAEAAAAAAATATAEDGGDDDGDADPPAAAAAAAATRFGAKRGPDRRDRGIGRTGERAPPRVRVVRRAALRRAAPRLFGDRTPRIRSLGTLQEEEEDGCGGLRPGREGQREAGTAVGPSFGRPRGSGGSSSSSSSSSSARAQQHEGLRFSRAENLGVAESATAVRDR
jgi:hypothetical protein